MKIKVPINYDNKKKEEVIALVNLTPKKVRQIVESFFGEMTYKEKRKWFKNNLVETDVYRLD